MNKIKYIGLSLLVICGLALTSCNRDYDDPKPFVEYTDVDFEDSKETIVTVRSLIDLYHSEVGTGGGIVQGLPLKDKGTDKGGNGWVIKGKVISSDRYGNVYRTMYVQDASVDASEAAAIEVKTGLTGFYNYYSPGDIVYIRCKDLVLGNYRYMISLGFPAVEDKYSNGFIDVKPAFTNEKDKYSIFLQGNREESGMVKGDTIVITNPDQLNDNMLGRLIRFEGVRHIYGSFDGDSYPNFFEQWKDIDGSTHYETHSFATAFSQWENYYTEYANWERKGKQGPEPSKPKIPEPGNFNGPTYGFKNVKVQPALNYYGNALFRFDGYDSDKPTHNLILRSSGYAKFADDLLPKEGEKVDITAIYTKFSAASGGYIKYQLMLNSVYDVKPSK